VGRTSNNSNHNPAGPNNTNGPISFVALCFKPVFGEVGGKLGGFLLDTAIFSEP
jgi:hypothetical protein